VRGGLERRVWIVASVVVLGFVMSILDTTIVNVALRTLAVDLKSPLSKVQWVITGYMLALGATIPLTGWAARRFGAKPTYLLSLVLFTAGSAACGMSTSIDQLIGFRVLQGVGGGMLMPVAMIIMAQVAGPKQMGRVMAAISMPVMVAPILGPVVGGLIVGNLHWSWIFFVNVPIGVVALLLGIRLLPHTDSGEAGPLDWLGLLLLPGGVVGVTYGLSELGSGRGVSDPRVVWPFLAGAVLVVLFCLHAPRAKRPLLDLSLYRNRIFAAAATSTLASSAALFGAMILIPLYYQVVRHQGVVAAGLLTAPQGIGAMVAMPLAVRLSERIGAGKVAVLGTALLCASTVPLALIGVRTSIVAISLVLVVRGLSIGMCFMPAMTAAFASLERHQLSDASPQLNVLQRLGGAVGTAAIAAVLSRSYLHARTPLAVVHGFDTAYWWALGIAALAFVPSLFLVRAEGGAPTAEAFEAVGA